MQWRSLVTHMMDFRFSEDGLGHIGISTTKVNNVIETKIVFIFETIQFLK
jgi:hypothetical protein